MSEQKQRQIITVKNILYLAIIVWAGYATADKLFPTGYSEIIWWSGIPLIACWGIFFVYDLIKKTGADGNEKPHSLISMSFLMGLSIMLYFIASLVAEFNSTGIVEESTVWGCILVGILLYYEVRSAQKDGSQGSQSECNR